MLFVSSANRKVVDVVDAVKLILVGAKVTPKTESLTSAVTLRGLVANNTGTMELSNTSAE